MMLLWLSFLVVTAANPHLIYEGKTVLGTPFTTTRPNHLPVRPKDVTVTVSPTVSNKVNRDNNGDQCQCVPYYLCDSDLNIVDNGTFTGYGQLDMKFGKEDCQESVERCCKDTKPYVEPTTIKPTVNKGCGYRNPQGIDFSITGGDGNEAQFGEFPWVVALLDSRNGSYVGVGVLIHPQVVMTGAHIAFKYPPNTLIARAGEWDTQTTKERLKSQERLVEDIVIREDFNPDNLQNDIALLRLQTPVELADHINVICLPDQDEDFDNSRDCVANGWGKDVFGLKGRYAGIIKKVEVNAVPFERCNSQLKRTRLGSLFKLHKSFICAGGEEGKDTCQGDGGAPLACPIGGNRYKLAGLVAWGIDCGMKDVPGVYARVPIFRRWIDDKILTWGLESDAYTIEWPNLEVRFG